MSLKKEEVLNGLYNAGAVGVSMASQKLFKDGLGVTRSASSVLRLAAAVGGGSVLVKFIQKKDWVPAEPFKSS